MRRGTFACIVAVVALLAAVVAATVQNAVGTVTGAHAMPLQGIQISFHDAVNAELLATATTDAAGHYDTGLIPTGNYRVEFFDPGPTYSPRFYGASTGVFCSGAIVPVLASTTTVIDAVLAPREPAVVNTDPPEPADIQGTVVDAATGSPLRGIRVSLLEAFDAELIASVVTDADGHFVYTLGETDSRLMRIRYSDPTGTFFPEFYGADSDTFCSATTVIAGEKPHPEGFLDRVPPGQLTQHLSETVASYDLPAEVATTLVTPLSRLQGFLADAHAANDTAGCGQLTSFVSRVEVRERRGELSPGQANELRSLAASLRSALGCQ
jgi:5-hydroxyisourate hydrolase-like protein (transthyretin family)